MIYTDQNPMPEADFTLGGHRYGVLGHDWRAVPPARWIALMSERETAREPIPVLPERSGEAALLALSPQEFAQAVRSLLRDMHRPDRLVHNPLLRCRLVESRLPATPAGADPGQEARLRALREVLDEAVVTLQASPGTRRASGRCVGPTWFRRRPKKSPPRSSAYRRAPTGGTCRPGSRQSSTSCGNKSFTPDGLRSLL
jgi:hypothetical protein